MEEKQLTENYRTERVVGKGSYGEVTLATHRAEGKKYVIKKLSLRSAPRRERKAAEQEAQLLSQLKHPNIVAYKESWEGEDGLLYIVMGFCEGGDLYHKLKEQKGQLLPEGQVVEWFVQITMALQYIHDLHIMHRDLKTQNIFLTKSDIIKVGDLGIARVLESQYDMASTLIGTPYYMSPELFSNKPYNYKSDVWALGCCVYEMTTLKHAFNAKDMNSLVYRIIEGKLPPMPKDYSNELRDLIGTMLNQHPEKRPTARQILRKPYIKQHIALFLQNTKLKQAKRRKKSVSSHSSVPKDGEVRAETAPSNRKKHKVNKGKSPVKTKADDGPPAALDLPHMNNPAASISSLSKVDIRLLPNDKRAPCDEHLILELQNDCRDTPGNVTQNCLKEQNIKVTPPPLNSNTENKILLPVSPASMEDEEDTMKLLQPINKADHQTNQESLDSTEKLLEPLVPIMKPDGARAEIQPHSSVCEPSVSRHGRHKMREDMSSNSKQFPVLCTRPLPSPPAIQHQAAPQSLSSPERKGNVSSPEKKDNVSSPEKKGNVSSPEKKGNVRSPEKKGTAAESGGSKPSRISQDHRPLSARERRRLKQSQEEISISVPAFRIDSAQAPNAAALPHLQEKRRHSVHGFYTDDDLSSSTNSTDKSEGECKVRKNSDSGEMNDLVSLMTQTLHMEKDDREVPPSACKEFKLHKRYRDTLMLHGRTPEEQEDLVIDNLTVPEKFRRMIEALRTDVVQGLGVKVLEEVYNVMDEESDTLRDLHLQKLLGEKYSNYNLKVRQLKFFEENSKFQML